jgi:hypothetical protein
MFNANRPDYDREDDQQAPKPRRQCSPSKLSTMHHSAEITVAMICFACPP